MDQQEPCRTPPRCGPCFGIDAARRGTTRAVVRLVWWTLSWALALLLVVRCAGEPRRWISLEVLREEGGFEKMAAPQVAPGHATPPSAWSPVEAAPPPAPSRVTAAAAPRPPNDDPGAPRTERANVSGAKDVVAVLGCRAEGPLPVLGSGCWSRQVLLVTYGIHPHRLELLERYRPFFWDIVYLCPHGSAFEELGANRSRDPCKLYASRDMGRVDMPFRHLADIASELAAPERAPNLRATAPQFAWATGLRQDDARGLRGVLYIHADFWLTPAFGLGADPDKIWIPRATRCLSGAEARTHPWWRANSFRKQVLPSNAFLAATRLLRAMYDEKSMPEKGYCNTNVDMLYLPRRAWTEYATWIRIAQRLGLRINHNEIAATIVAQYIARPGSRVGLEVQSCLARCCVGATPVEVAQHNCGHKANWRTSAVREAFKDVWDLYAEVGHDPLSKR